MLRELLAKDGSIYVHLDQKKGHYLKCVLDEIFGEENFRSEVIWKRTVSTGSSKARANKYPVLNDTLYLYSKSDQYIFNTQYIGYSSQYVSRFTEVDENGEKFYWDNLKSYSEEKLKQLIDADLIKLPLAPGKNPRYKNYLSKGKGVVVDNIWVDIPPVNSQAGESENYPTQKPEQLLERVINASSNPNDIVLDAFGGAGTTPAIAEKLGRRWIAMDCGKLAIYTMQKRLFSLTTTIGSTKKDERTEPERVEDWNEHLKSVPGLLLITEKARNGECEVTIDLLNDLAALVKKHDLFKKGAALSLVCPEEKLLVPTSQLDDIDEGPGTKQITVQGLQFRISFVPQKEKTEKDKSLQAREFALYRAGIYDMAAIKAMPWTEYRPFVLKLFGVREHVHHRYGYPLDGYLSTDSALVWNYPDHKKLTLDHGYVDDLHRTLRGKPGERFYIIAPVLAMVFAEDEVARDKTTYVFLKVPLSVLRRLIEQKEPAAFKQPTKESDVNEVINAVGFDFISQPKTEVKAKRQKRKGEMFIDCVIEISEFRSQTLATDPEDFANFETFSMAMVDLNYDGDVFRLSRVFWGEDLLKEAGGLEKAESLSVRIAEEDFIGKRMMVILCDRYGNEKALVFDKKDFR